MGFGHAHGASRPPIPPATTLIQQATPPSFPDVLNTVHAPSVQHALQPKPKCTKRTSNQIGSNTSTSQPHHLRPTPNQDTVKNWRMSGPFWRKFTIPKELTNKRLDLPLLQLTTSGAHVDTHTLDLPETLGTLPRTNNQPPLPSKVNSTYFVRTWTRSSSPLPTSSPATTTTQDLPMPLH